MLTTEENSWNIQTLKIISALNILPIKIEHAKYGKTRIQIHTSKLRRFLWKSVFSLAILHLMYSVGRFIQSLVQPELFRLDRIVVHFLFIVGYSTEYYNGYRTFLKSHDEYIIISNQLFNQQKQKNQQQQQQESEDEEAEQEKTDRETDKAPKSARRVKRPYKISTGIRIGIRPWFKWPFEYSLQESMALLMPFIAMTSGLFAVLVLGLDSSRPQLLYSILPEKYQNWSSFSLLFSVEVVTFSLVVANFYLSNFTQLEFLENIQYKFEQVTRKLGVLMNSSARGRSFQDACRGNQILGEILVEMHQLYVFIHLFNRCFPFCIFSMKIFYLTDSIFGYFFIIRHFKEQPIYATFSGYIALVCTSLYSGIYSKAFVVPQNMYRVKSLFLMAARRFNVKKTKTTTKTKVNGIDIDLFPLFAREIRRIRNVGIRVGDFHSMERESTPNFIDFVVKQLVTLLVTIPR